MGTLAASSMAEEMRGLPPVVERAKAKVNLTLHVRGRRPDGYHELESLVMFADLSDEVRFEPGDADTIEVAGPFATAIDGDNLISKAKTAVAGWLGQDIAGAFHLTKNIPVAAGLGGGSSDAAAAIRALFHVFADGNASAVLPASVAARIGADVPVCLHHKAAWMWGLGEHVAPAPAVCGLPALLVNPRLKLSTRDVFTSLDAALCTSSASCPSIERPWRGPACAVDYLAEGRNDLEAPAIRLQPMVKTVLSAIKRLNGCMLSRLSGSGPTCFGLFTTIEQVYEAKQELARDHPGWWAAAVTLS